MKVLSIKQPWASLIVNGYKAYEFRSWNTNFRGTFLIHASQSVEKNMLKRFETLNLEYPTGAIIGSVELTDSIKVDAAFETNLIQQNELVYGASRGRCGYAFQLSHVKKFDQPISVKGKLGFWNYEVNDDLEKK